MLINKRFGNYVLGETLGAGSFGKVKLATSVVSNEKVAIKVVDKGSMSDIDDIERIYRETFILTSLNHRHIIKLIEVIDTPTNIMLVMEYAAGGDLLKYLQTHKRLDEREAFRLFNQIMSGVEYCHRMKILHRDLKLDNILMEKGDVKIADFGLSNSIKFRQRMNTNCGTPAYTPPEQLANEKFIGESADMWSMGVILFAMVCGFLPFEAPNLPKLFKKISRLQYKAPNYITKDCRDVISSLLVLNPADRKTIMDLRGFKWCLMDFNEDLLAEIDQIGQVSPQQVQEAQAACQAVGAGSKRSKPMVTAVLMAHPPAGAPPSKHSQQQDRRRMLGPGPPPRVLGPSVLATTGSLSPEHKQLRISSRPASPPNVPQAPHTERDMRDRAASIGQPHNIFSDVDPELVRAAHLAAAEVVHAAVKEARSSPSGTQSALTPHARSRISPTANSAATARELSNPSKRASDRFSANRALSTVLPAPGSAAALGNHPHSSGSQQNHHPSRPAAPPPPPQRQYSFRSDSKTNAIIPGGGATLKSIFSKHPNSSSSSPPLDSRELLSTNSNRSEASPRGIMSDSTARRMRLNNMRLTDNTSGNVLSVPASGDHSPPHSLSSQHQPQPPQGQSHRRRTIPSSSSRASSADVRFPSLTLHS